MSDDKDQNSVGCLLIVSETVTGQKKREGKGEMPHSPPLPGMQ